MLTQLIQPAYATSHVIMKITNAGKVLDTPTYHAIQYTVIVNLCVSIVTSIIYVKSRT